MSQVRAKDLIGPDERPAVGMKLGGGYVEFSQELPLEAGEGESELDFLEHRCIDEAEDVFIKFSFLHNYPIWFKTLFLKNLDMKFPFSTFSQLIYDFKPLPACVALAFLFLLPYWLKSLLFCVFQCVF